MGRAQISERVMDQKSWDVFISHASEDKISIAKPLAEGLRRSGVRVWLDVDELCIGDSLSEAIDEGLSQSHFGIVILSESFFNKHWPRRELSGLRSREECGKKVILPVWHGVDKNYIANFSPTLADAIAYQTSEGIQSAVERLVQVIFSSESPASVEKSLCRRLVELIESGNDREQLPRFIENN